MVCTGFSSSLVLTHLFHISLCLNGNFLVKLKMISCISCVIAGVEQRHAHKVANWDQSWKSIRLRICIYRVSMDKSYTSMECVKLTWRFELVLLSL